MTPRQHYELVFIASRIGIPVLLACSYKEGEILEKICSLCRNGDVSDIFTVHSDGKCVIHEDMDYYCRVKLLQGIFDSQGQSPPRYDNSTTPFERDYLVYVLARRTNRLQVAMEDLLGMTLTCCSLCREGIQVHFDPRIHNNGDCAGKYVESEGLDERNLEKQCWVHRFWYWCHDPTRMERDHELI